MYTEKCMALCNCHGLSLDLSAVDTSVVTGKLCMVSNFSRVDAGIMRQLN